MNKLSLAALVGITGVRGLVSSVCCSPVGFWWELNAFPLSARGKGRRRVNLDNHAVKSWVYKRSGMWVCSCLLLLLLLWTWITFILVQRYCVRSERSPDITWLIGAPQWIGSGPSASSWMPYWVADRKPCSDNKGRNDSAIAGSLPWAHICASIYCHASWAAFAWRERLSLFCAWSFSFLFCSKCHVSQRQRQDQNKTTAGVTESESI